MTHLAPPLRPSVTINTLSGMRNVGQHICSETIPNMFSSERRYPKLSISPCWRNPSDQNSINVRCVCVCLCVLVLAMHYTNRGPHKVRSARLCVCSCTCACYIVFNQQSKDNFGKWGHFSFEGLVGILCIMSVWVLVCVCICVLWIILYTCIICIGTSVCVWRQIQKCVYMVLSVCV